MGVKKIWYKKDFQTHVLLVREKFKMESLKLKIENVQLLF